jgi:uncharacterized protein YkwD
VTRSTVIKDVLFAIFIVIIFCCLFLLTHAFQDTQTEEVVLEQNDGVAVEEQQKRRPVPEPVPTASQTESSSGARTLAGKKSTPTAKIEGTVTTKKETPAPTEIKELKNSLLTPDTQAAQTVSAVPIASNKNQFEQEVFEIIKDRTNEFRKKNNRLPYTTDSALNQNTRGYSQRMLKSNFLSHTDENGCDLTCRFKADGYVASTWGENLAKIEFTDTPTPNEVADFFMNGWEKSSGHRENLLSAEFERQGIGIAIGRDAIYATVQFAQ